jgi:hypothetical protein
MSMPSWEVHEKYAKLMGIPIEVAKEINKLMMTLDGMTSSTQPSRREFQHPI